MRDCDKLIVEAVHAGLYVRRDGWETFTIGLTPTAHTIRIWRTGKLSRWDCDETCLDSITLATARKALGLREDAA